MCGHNFSDSSQFFSVVPCVLLCWHLSVLSSFLVRLLYILCCLIKALSSARFLLWTFLFPLLKVYINNFYQRNIPDAFTVAFLFTAFCFFCKWRVCLQFDLQILQWHSNSRLVKKKKKKLFYTLWSLLVVKNPEQFNNCNFISQHWASHFCKSWNFVYNEHCVASYQALPECQYVHLGILTWS